ncbi:DUF5681 domain-containing protein [Afipia sp. DC4300-2b1]|uniref:DUF5681 domain-containing protein n=1 Tax=Afipia sp. DC4300-2b1 TaxID=2804672 RepID=UPI003CEE60A7
MAKPQKSKVGYRNPPKHGQFKKGQSGNAKGRPRGAKGIKTLLAKELGSRITIGADGQQRRVKRSEALIKGLVNDALRGKDRPRDTVLRMADQIEQDAQARQSRELSAEDQAILDRYVERRLKLLRRSQQDDTEF